MAEQNAAPREYPVSIAEKNDIDNRFTYHAPRPDQLPRYQTIRELARNMAHVIARTVPPGRERALALTKLEETVMIANAGIAREAPAERSVALVVKVTSENVPVPSISERTKLRDLMAAALEQGKFETDGRAWYVTDDVGHHLDLDKTLAELALKDGDTLLVQLPAGFGG